MELKDALVNNELHWYKDIEHSLHDFPIFLRSNEWVTGTKFHHQPGVEIHVTQEGAGTLVIGSQVIPQAPRSVVVFRGAVPHQMISKSSYKRTVILLDTSENQSTTLPMLHSLIDFSWIPKDSCLSFSLDPVQYQRIEEMCSALRHELSSQDIGWERMALMQVLQITVFLQRSLKETKPSAAQNTHVLKRKSSIVRECSDYIIQNLGEELALKNIAKKFSVSEEYLTRSFTKEMGISYYQYVLLQRIAEGKRLLREASDVSISEIAYLIGFPTASHFSKHFKTLMGETPSAFRHRAVVPETIIDN
jgi:AraC-like DNA-binding protein